MYAASTWLLSNLLTKDDRSDSEALSQIALLHANTNGRTGTSYVTPVLWTSSLRLGLAHGNREDEHTVDFGRGQPLRSPRRGRC